MKLTLFIIAMLLTGTEALANMSSDNIRTKVECIEGVKVLFTWAAYGDADHVTAIQLYEANGLNARGELPPTPMKCD